MRRIMERTLTCRTCGREIIGVNNDYQQTWICSDCYRIKDPTEALGCERGTKIIFKYPENGTEYDQERANKHLVKDKYYTVHLITIGSWSSTIELEEFPGIKFNSVHFERSTKGNRRYRIHIEEAALAE